MKLDCVESIESVLDVYICEGKLQQIKKVVVVLLKK
jgi:hypothetical protein